MSTSFCKRCGIEPVFAENIVGKGRGNAKVTDNAERADVVFVLLGHGVQHRIAAFPYLMEVRDEQTVRAAFFDGGCRVERHFTAELVVGTRIRFVEDDERVRVTALKQAVDTLFFLLQTTARGEAFIRREVRADLRI